MAAQQTPRTSELDQVDWLLLEATVERLEEAWRTDADPQLGRFVPPCAPALRVRVPGGAGEGGPGASLGDPAITGSSRTILPSGRS